MTVPSSFRIVLGKFNWLCKVVDLKKAGILALSLDGRLVQFCLCLTYDAATVQSGENCIGRKAVKRMLLCQIVLFFYFINLLRIPCIRNVLCFIQYDFYRLYLKELKINRNCLHKLRCMLYSTSPIITPCILRFL